MWSGLSASCKTVAESVKTNMVRLWRVMISPGKTGFIMRSKRPWILPIICKSLFCKVLTA